MVVLEEANGEKAGKRISRKQYDFLSRYTNKKTLEI